MENKVKCEQCGYEVYAEQICEGLCGKCYIQEEALEKSIYSQDKHYYELAYGVD